MHQIDQAMEFIGDRHLTRLLKMLAAICSFALTPYSSTGQWLKANGTERQIIKCLAAKDSVMFAGGFGGNYSYLDTMYVGGVLRSADNGANWTQVNSGFFTVTGATISVFSLAFRGTNLFAGTQNGIFVSSDYGDSWSQTNFDPTQGEVRTLLIEDKVMFAGTDVGESASMLDTMGGVFCSTDNGSTWKKKNSGLMENPYARRILALIRKDSTLIAGSGGGGIFNSTNNGDAWNHYYGTDGWIITVLDPMDSIVFAGTWYGAVFGLQNYSNTWVSKDSGLKDPVTQYDYSVSAIAGFDLGVFAGTLLHGVFLSKDLGASWSPVNEGIKSATVYAFLESPQFVIAGTNFGVWRRPVSELITGITRVPSTHNVGFDLHQNFPNPFNPSTTIRFSIPERSLVRVAIFNLLGQQVAELANEELKPGNFERVWNANVASGLYFYRLEAVSVTDPSKRFVEVKKMVLVK